MVHVVWLATTSKKMLIGQAMDIGIGCLDARRSLFVARRAIAACFNRFPMVGDAFKKLVVVAIPSAIGACRRIGQCRRIVLSCARLIASDGDERDCHERQPVMFVVFHYAIPHQSLG